LRQPGERWLIRGPCEYVPPIGIEVAEKRTSIPLGESEGIYVRNTKTGEVRAVIGSTYMLTEEEEHWEKVLSSKVKELLEVNEMPYLGRSRFEQTILRESSSFDMCGLQVKGPRMEPKPFPVISLQVPHNAAVQINDYWQNKSRVEFGPVLVLLGPHEQFTLLSLSGGKPKRPHTVKSLYLLLGPDFVTDMVVVETADHARLSLQLAYNWIFDTTDALENQKEAAKLFSVPDFVGDTCKAMASRIRGAVASISFDYFHKNSARIIRAACLGLDNAGKVQDWYMFPENRLRITGVDIQSVAPGDEHISELLMKSVQMAIEITTNSLEASARYVGLVEVQQQEREQFDLVPISNRVFNHWKYQFKEFTSNAVSRWDA
ncbi:hypothetical protein P879_10377, partial [Paragonimus westermani]